ncbi:hypothetical protein D3C87_1402240 [compost metagenome]
MITKENGHQTNITMQDIAGLEDHQVRNPYWFNTGTGELFQTDKHHSREFAIFPEMVGTTHADLEADLPYDRQTQYFEWVLGYTNLLLARGWARIDTPSPDEIIVWAGGLDWAEIAIRCAADLSGAPVERMTVCVWVDNDAQSTQASRAIFHLAGSEAKEAVASGLSRWARPELHTKNWSRSTFGAVPDANAPSKMRAAPAQNAWHGLDEESRAVIASMIAKGDPEGRATGRCPFGHGVR